MYLEGYLLNLHLKSSSTKIVLKFNCGKGARICAYIYIYVYICVSVYVCKYVWEWDFVEMRNDLTRQDIGMLLRMKWCVMWTSFDLTSHSLPFLSFSFYFNDLFSFYPVSLYFINWKPLSKKTKKVYSL